MRYLVAAIGKSKEGPERSLFDLYRKRLGRLLELREIDLRKPLSPPEKKEREAALLLAEVPDGAYVVALDERGRDLSSADLAATLGRARDEGRAAAFLIGGADGHHPSIRDRADLVLSFGRLTWPHMLVRALLAEQIYRSECILAGHPYHRE